MSSSSTPGFRSLALDSIPAPDFADVQLVSLPRGLSARLALTPRDAAEAVFAVDALPASVKLLVGLRQALVKLIGVSRAERDIFNVAAVVGPEALISADASHLDFRAGVAIEDDLLRVTTAVRLKGWRGRLYFIPVRQVHAPLTRIMMRAAVRRWERAAG